MTKSPSKLGRGLSALMEEITPPKQEAKSEATGKNNEAKSEATGKREAKAPKPQKTAPNELGVQIVWIDKLERNPDQPRRHFDKTKLAELTQSIKDKGVLQPILVRPIKKGAGGVGRRPPADKDVFQIVAGERRWQAAVTAGLEKMPVLVRELSDRDVLEIGVVENVQRADLNPIEEAMAYQALKDQFDRKQEDIAKAIGKSRSHVANCLRLLSLPVLAREYLADGKITPGHARAILAAPDPQALAEAIVSKDLTVRGAEKWLRMMQASVRGPAPEKPRRDADSRFIEKQLAEHLGLAVRLNHKNPDGNMTIKYKTLGQLEDLIARLRKS